MKSLSTLPLVAPRTTKPDHVIQANTAGIVGTTNFLRSLRSLQSIRHLKCKSSKQIKFDSGNFDSQQAARVTVMILMKIGEWNYNFEVINHRISTYDLVSWLIGSSDMITDLLNDRLTEYIEQCSSLATITLMNDEVILLKQLANERTKERISQLAESSHSTTVATTASGYNCFVMPQPN